MADYLFLLESRFNPSQLAVVEYLQRVCHGTGLNLYLTGGPMRDLLVGAPVHTLDFTTEGSPLVLEQRVLRDGVEVLLADREEDSLRLRMHNVRFRVSGAQRADDSTHGQPRLSPGSIVDDLRRRGFTLNSIGLSLNPGSRGLLLDPTNGLADLESKLIRMTHNYVFLNDPVRLLRAVRLRTRLHFELEERTQARMEAAIEGQYLENYASASSLGRELEALAYEPDPSEVLKALEEAKLLVPSFGEGMKTAKMNLAAMARMPQAITELEQVGINADSGPVALHYMTAKLPPKDLSRLTKLHLSKPLLKSWQKLEASTAALEKNLSNPALKTLADIEQAVKAAPSEAVLFATLGEVGGKAERVLKQYLGEVPKLKERLPMRELQQLGLSPKAPAFRQILFDLLHRMLRGELKTEAPLLEAMKAAAEASGALPKAEEKSAPRGRGKAKPAEAAGAEKPRPSAEVAVKPAPAAATAGEKAAGKAASKPEAGKSAAKAQPKVAGKPEAKASDKAKAAKPEAKTKPEAKAKPAAKPASNAKPAGKAQAAVKPAAKAKAASQPAAKKPVAKKTTPPAGKAKAAAKPAHPAKPKGKVTKVTQAKPKPAAKKVTKPAAKPAAKKAGQPAAKSAAKKSAGKAGKKAKTARKR